MMAGKIPAFFSAGPRTEHKDTLLTYNLFLNQKAYF